MGPLGQRWLGVVSEAVNSSAPNRARVVPEDDRKVATVLSPAADQIDWQTREATWNYGGGHKLRSQSSLPGPSAFLLLSSNSLKESFVICQIEG